MPVPPAHYSLGRRRKNNEIQARSAIALSLGETHWETESMQCIMDTGRERNILGGVSYFV